MSNIVKETLQERLERMKIRNEEIRRRHMEVEEDKKKAAMNKALVNTVVPPMILSNQAAGAGKEGAYAMKKENMQSDRFGHDHRSNRNESRFVDGWDDRGKDHTETNNARRYDRGRGRNLSYARDGAREEGSIRKDSWNNQREWDKDKIGVKSRNYRAHQENRQDHRNVDVSLKIELSPQGRSVGITSVPHSDSGFNRKSTDFTGSKRVRPFINPLTVEDDKDDMYDLSQFDEPFKDIEEPIFREEYGLALDECPAQNEQDSVPFPVTSYDNSLDEVMMNIKNIDFSVPPPNYNPPLASAKMPSALPGVVPTVIPLPSLIPSAPPPSTGLLASPTNENITPQLAQRLLLGEVTNVNTDVQSCLTMADNREGRGPRAIRGSGFSSSSKDRTLAEDSELFIINNFQQQNPEFPNQNFPLSQIMDQGFGYRENVAAQSDFRSLHNPNYLQSQNENVSRDYFNVNLEVQSNAAQRDRTATSFLAEADAHVVMNQPIAQTSDVLHMLQERESRNVKRFSAEDQSDINRLLSSRGQPFLRQQGQNLNLNKRLQQRNSNSDFTRSQEETRVPSQNMASRSRFEAQNGASVRNLSRTDDDKIYAGLNQSASAPDNRASFTPGFGPKHAATALSGRSPGSQAAHNTAPSNTGQLKGISVTDYLMSQASKSDGNQSAQQRVQLMRPQNQKTNQPSTQSRRPSNWTDNKVAHTAFSAHNNLPEDARHQRRAFHNDSRDAGFHRNRPQKDNRNFRGSNFNKRSDNYANDAEPHSKNFSESFETDSESVRLQRIGCPYDKNTWNNSQTEPTSNENRRNPHFRSEESHVNAMSNIGHFQTPEKAEASGKTPTVPQTSEQTARKLTSKDCKKNTDDDDDSWEDLSDSGEGWNRRKPPGSKTKKKASDAKKITVVESQRTFIKKPYQFFPIEDVREKDKRLKLEAEKEKQEEMEKAKQDQTEKETQQMEVSINQKLASEEGQQNMVTALAENIEKESIQVNLMSETLENVSKSQSNLYTETAETENKGKETFSERVQLEIVEDEQINSEDILRTETTESKEKENLSEQMQLETVDNIAGLISEDILHTEATENKEKENLSEQMQSKTVENIAELISEDILHTEATVNKEKENLSEQMQSKTVENIAELISEDILHTEATENKEKENLSEQMQLETVDNIAELISEDILHTGATENKEKENLSEQMQLETVDNIAELISEDILHTETTESEEKENLSEQTQLETVENIAELISEDIFHTEGTEDINAEENPEKTEQYFITGTNLETSSNETSDKENIEADKTSEHEEQNLRMDSLSKVEESSESVSQVEETIEQGNSEHDCTKSENEIHVEEKIVPEEEQAAVETTAEANKKIKIEEEGSLGEDKEEWDSGEWETDSEAED